METKFVKELWLKQPLMNFEIPAKTLPYQRSPLKTLHPKNETRLTGGERGVNWQPSNSFYRHVIVTFKISQPRPSCCIDFGTLGSALRASLPTTFNQRIPTHHFCKNSPFFGASSDGKEQVYRPVFWSFVQFFSDSAWVRWGPENAALHSNGQIPNRRAFLMPLPNAISALPISLSQRLK